MKKMRILSMLLCLALAVSLVAPGLPVRAAESNGLVYNKAVTKKSEGVYTITLDAYATGEKTITTTKKDKPTDIILVLDQSGSMANDIGTVTFDAYSNKRNRNLFDKRHNGGSNNLWYPLGNGEYASVSVTVEQQASYSIINSGYNNSTRNNRTSYYDNRTRLAAKVDGVYYDVTVTLTQNYGTNYYTYTYKDNDGVTHTIASNSRGDRTEPPFTGIDDGKLYLKTVDETKTVYTYSYTDKQGTLQTIGTSTGANTNFGTTLYQRNTSNEGGGQRLASLKNAATLFANNVAKKAKGEDQTYGTDDDVDHQIAIVGFAHGPTANEYWDMPAYVNTEVFIGANQYGYGTAAQGQYGNAFQDMSTQTGRDNVAASITALDAFGGTYTNLGMEMANGILNANPADSSERNRVIIVFTDGVPGETGYDSSVANAAINYANTAKNSGVKVYAVGIFGEADENDPGTANTPNWFMQNLSSNNGTPGKYYSTPKDAAGLNAIFEQISQDIEDGSSSSTLDKNAVIKDVVSESFVLPEGVSENDITITTYELKSSTKQTQPDGTVVWVNDVWEKVDNDPGVSASVDPDAKTVTATGFDYAKNYVYRNDSKQGGKKLEIRFDVEVRPGFLGGNGVPTNASAGIYENDKAETPVVTYNQPLVDVQINSIITVTAPDKNVYLMDSPKAGVVATIQDATNDKTLYEIKLSEPNYGLQPWQYAYVTISDSGENYQRQYTELTDDVDYSVTVRVDPNSTGTATSKSGSDSAKINVFKPTMTFQDGFVNPNTTITNTGYMGKDANGADAAKSYKDDNYVSTVWKHEGVEDKSVTMATSKPTIDLAYTPAATTASSGDVNVAVAAKIGNNPINDYTTFVHNPCDDDVKCDWKTPDPNKGNPAFQLHVNTSTMTIKKMVTGNMGDQSKTFKFKVTIDGVEQPGEINLTHDHTCAPIEVKVGSVVQITETNKGKYTMSGTGGGGQMKENSKDTYTFTVQADPAKNQIVITNEFEADVDTGFVDDVLPFVIIFMLVAACGAGLLLYHETRYRGIY